MNIRSRTFAGMVLAVALLALAVLHFLWAGGNPFPAGSFAQLEKAVLPQPGFPGTWLTVLVALALLAAAIAAALRTVDLNRGRHQRSRLLRASIYAIAAAFGLRALEGVVSGISWLLQGADRTIVGAEYRAADLAFYTPLCIVLCLAALALAGRPRVPVDLYEHTLTLFRRESFVHVVTLAPDGAPRSRVLYRLSVDDDGTVWFSTDRDSQKAHDIRADPRVVLSVYDSKAQAAATLEGTAEVVTDPEVLVQHWYAPLRLYFPKGTADARYALIRVTPLRFGVVDFSRDVTPAPFGLRRESQEVNHTSVLVEG